MAILILLIFGGAVAAIANSKGRNAVGWFFLGFFFPIIALILVCLLPNLEAEQRKHQLLLDQQRRLKEKLKQEKMKNESFRQFTADRLDSHDNMLGVDTKTSGNLIGESPGKPPQLANPASQQTDQKIWFFDDNGQEMGPITLDRISQLINAKRINNDTLLWRKGLEDWLPAQEINEINEILPA